MHNMVLGGAHFIIREHRSKLHIYYASIKYKIMNNNSYYLIHLCCLFEKRPKQYDAFSCTFKNYLVNIEQ